MCKLIIEQKGFNRVDFEFKSIVDASIIVDYLKPYSENTKFTIEVTTEKESENHDTI